MVNYQLLLFIVIIILNGSARATVIHLMVGHQAALPVGASLHRPCSLRSFCSTSFQVFSWSNILTSFIFLTLHQSLLPSSQHDQITSIYLLITKLMHSTPILPSHTGSTTMYDNWKQKYKQLNFVLNADVAKLAEKCFTLTESRVAEPDKALYKLFVQKRAENYVLSGPLFIQKAKDFHKELNL